MSDGIRNRAVSSSVAQTTRKGTNSIDKQLMNLNETILNNIFNIYTDKDIGLCRFGKLLDVVVRVPRRKINVLLLGNHSAGKSSFINWYIEETILKTGVAIETQGFSFVVSGKKRDTLKGQATLQLYPHLKPLQEYAGVMDFLSTEISTSRSKKFNLVTFIDTPGLVDGDMHYPFDVNETLMWLGDMADMVLVFFDPMGQALCKRTLNIVEKMWASHSEKIRLYLAKADEAGSETDRQKVLMQIVQELCKRPGLNRSGFDMPTIFLPDASSKPTKCANQINEVCLDIEKMIEQTVQNSLNNLERDCEEFEKHVSNRLQLDKEARSRNRRTCVRSWCMGFLGIFLPVLLFLSLVVANATVEAMRQHIGQAADIIRIVINPCAAMWSMVPAAYHLQVVTFVVCVSGALLIASRFSPSEPTIPTRELKILKIASDVVDKAIEKKKSMYTEYLRQSVADEDFTN